MDSLLLVGVILFLFFIFIELSLLVYFQLKALGFEASPPLFPVPKITREDPKVKEEPKGVPLDQFIPAQDKELKLVFEEETDGTHGVSEVANERN